jgi:hypothetical protein
MGSRKLSLGTATAPVACLLVGMSPLLASPAVAGACGTPPSYANWVGNGFTCTLDNGALTFSNFTFSSSTGILASQIAVQPDGLGFLFSTGALTVPPGTNNDITLDYDVTASPGTLIDDASMTIAGAVIPAGTGTVSVGDTLTLGNGTTTTLTVGIPSPLTDSVTFSPTASLGVLKDANVVSLPGNTTTSLSSILQDYSVTTVAVIPEASTWAMMLLGLAGLGYAGLRSRKTSVSIV